MWRELVEGLTSDVSFGEPADDRAVANLSERLGQVVPVDLASLLLEVGSIQDKYGSDIVWPADRIVQDNVEFRTAVDFADLYMPFDPLMFFGDAGDGSQFAYVRRPARQDVFVWDHETDGRWWIASDLRVFLTRHFGAESPDWYRRL